MPLNRKYFILIVFCCYGLIANGQTKSSNKNVDSLKKEPKNIISVNQISHSRDSIVISLQDFKEIKELVKKEDNPWKDILPSIIALAVVAISTWGAIYIGKKQIKSQIKNGEEQLRSQEAQSQEQLKVAREQIKEGTNVALKQIDWQNRQEWVNDTRNTIAELTAQINLMNIEFQEIIQSPDRKKLIHEKIVYNKNKIHLLLKPEKEKHKKLLDSIGELMGILDVHLLNSKNNNDPNNKIGIIPYDNVKFMQQTNLVIEDARNLLYEEWGKIQS